VTCAKILAAIYARLGKSVQTFGDYAGERSGAPIRAYTRVSDTQVTNRNKVYEPDHVLVLDQTLLGADAVAGLAEGGLLLVDSEGGPEELASRYERFRVATVDAKAIGEGLAQTGHIALYGLTFASDSASLDPGSQPTLVQMAKVLGEQPALKVYIVGHTDSTGNLAHNLDLSQRRAEAVVAALAKDYHIAPTRLLAKGMASFAPVASNDDESGRARNRRVELVKQ